MNVVEKILSEHLVSGEMVPGNEISIKIDQALTQDATGTMAYLQFESMGLDRVKADLLLVMLTIIQYKLVLKIQTTMITSELLQKSME